MHKIHSTKGKNKHIEPPSCINVHRIEYVGDKHALVVVVNMTNKVNVKLISIVAAKNHTEIK